MTDASPTDPTNAPPRVKSDLDWTSLDLSPEEGFVLSRIDGHTSPTNLAQVTGFDAARIETILTKLAAQGALDGPPAPVAPSVPSSVVGLGPTLNDDDDDDDDDSDLVEDAYDEDYDDVDATAGLDEDDDDDAALDDDDENLDEGDAAENEEDTGANDDAERAESDYRRVYVDQFRELDSDERVRIAQTARGAALCALCFDPDHRVIAAILENGRVTQKHARLIAKHHRTATGLDRIGRVVVFLRDKTTQRFLVRNTQLSDALFRKMMGPKRLLEVFHMTTNREATEKVRRTARKIFRTKFQIATAEERVQLVFSSEARCLPPLLGISFDGRTTALMCGRTVHSTLLVQNLARFPGTPPALLVHLAKSPIVKRMPQLRALIRQHANCPSALKASLT